jgi:hypothetical protein
MASGTAGLSELSDLPYSLRGMSVDRSAEPGSHQPAAPPAAQSAAPPADWDASLSRRAGAKTAKALAGLGLHTVGDLIRHYPRKYLDRGELTDLTALELDEHVTVLAQVGSITAHAMRGRPGWRVQVTIGDGRGELQLVFFTAKQWQRDRLAKELAVDSMGLSPARLGNTRGGDSSPIRCMTF